MLPEAYKSGTLTLYRARSFPDDWEAVSQSRSTARRSMQRLFGTAAGGGCSIRPLTMLWLVAATFTWRGPIG